MSDLNDPRVFFAAERTLLAWNRTSIALIAFGFLVERAGLLMNAFAPEKANTLSMTITFWVGLTFIITGCIAAVYSSLQYAEILKTLHSDELPRGYAAKWGMFVNWLVAVLGLVLAVVLFIGH